MVLMMFAALSVAGLFTARESYSALGQLARNVLNDNTNLVDQQIADLVGSAERTALIVPLLLNQDGNYSAENFEFERAALALPNMASILVNGKDLAYLSITSANSGEFVQVSFDAKQRIVFQTNRRNTNGTYDRRDWIREGRSEIEIFRDTGWKVDSRTRPYFLAAKESQKHVWTPAYDFIGSAGQTGPKGVTCALPVRDQSGKLLAVITADITLKGIEHFLERLNLGESGYGFVIEQFDQSKNEVLAVPAQTEQSEKRLEQVGFLRSLLQTKNIRQSKAKIDATQTSIQRINNENLVVGYRRTSIPGVNWVIFTVVAESAFTSPIESATKIVVQFGLWLTMVGVAAAIFLAGRITKPLTALNQVATQIKRLNLEESPLPDSSIKEVQTLSSSLESMRSGLVSFRRLVPATYVEHLLHSDQEAVLGGERVPLTVLFCDLEGFTGYSESRDPGEVMTLLNHFLETVSEEIAATGGTIDKFLGDEVMAFWGAPHPQADAAIRAARAAAAIQNLFERKIQEAQFPLKIRVGITSGQAIVGNIGTEDRLNYTAVGDSVNLASRLQGLNKVYGTTVLLDAATHGAISDSFLTRVVDNIAVVGREGATMVYEILDERPGDPGLQEVCSLTNRAFTKYQERQFAAATALYYEAMLLRPEDEVVNTMMERCRQYESVPPPRNWAGVHQALTK